MAGKLTAEQNDRLERVLRAITHESMSADAVEEMPAQIGPLDKLDQRTPDEILGCDEYGLPN